jgi:hypothetical protein
MAKTKISEFSSTPSDNTDIDSINIAEGCAPSGINNAIRELMAQLKDQQTGAAGDSFVVGGGFTSAGAAVFSSNVAVAGTFTSSGAAILSSTLAVTSNATVGGTLSVTGSVITPTVISVTDNTNAALRVTQLGTGNALLVEDSTNPDATPFVIDPNGVVITGAEQSYTVNGVSSTRIQIHGLLQASSSEAIANWGATSTSPFLATAKSRSGTVGTHIVVQSGDGLGTWVAQGSDGTGFITAAQIKAEVDGTPGTNDMPGRLVFSTTADGAASPTERVRIGSAGQIGIAGANYGTTGQVLTSNGSAAAPAWGSLEPAVTLLGTLTTTSGTTHTLSGLDLTGYTSLSIFFQNVGGPASVLRINTETISSHATAGLSTWGNLVYSLLTSVYASNVSTGSAATGVSVDTQKGYAGKGAINTATVSLSFTWASGSFARGTITVYGVK